MEKTRNESRFGRFAYLSKGEGNPRRNRQLLMVLVLAGLFTLFVPVTATEYSGDYLVTANGSSGSVTGGLYYDDYYRAFEYGYPTAISKQFTLPASAVGNIEWARLEVITYAGLSTGFRNISVHTSVNNGSVHVLPDAVSTSEYNWGLKSVNWNGTSSSRVSSDVVSWYDVKDYLTSPSVTVSVSNSMPDGTRPADGRVKAIILMVAYNNATSGRQYYYWVNQGHDVSAYLSSPDEHIGSTTFSTSAVPEIGTANLTALYISSYNGNYTFNGQASDLSDNNQLTWMNPKQGSYFGSTSWDVTGKLTQGSNSDLKYTRNGTAAGSYSGYFKIPLAILTVENKKFTYDAGTNGYDGCTGAGVAAFKDAVADAVPTVASEPAEEFDSTGYSNIAEADENTEDASSESAYAAHRFTFTVCQACGDVSNLTAIWTGSGSNDDGINNGVNLSIWNYATGAYEQLDETTVDGSVTLSGSKTSELCNYLDSNHRVIILAEQKGIGADLSASYLSTDYVNLEVHR